VTKAATGSITITHGTTSQSIALSSVALSLNGLTATIDPADFPFSTVVGVSVPNTAFRDAAGNAYAGTTATSWSFTTGTAPDTQAPTATLSPANGATNVSVSSNLVLTFSEPITKGATGSITITHGTTSQSIAFSSIVLSTDGRTATINPADFPFSTVVGVSVPNTAFRDAAGNAYAGTTAASWSFTTGAAPLQEIRVNFQDAATVPTAGWLRDYGQPFGLRTGTNQGSNMTYGWKKRSDGTLLDLSVGGSSNLGNGRNRNSSLDPDIDVLLATIMHMQANDLPTTFNGTRVEGYWEIKVPNGGYDVTVSAGDGAVNSDPEVHSLNVEGINAMSGFVASGTAGALTRFKSGTVRVVVSDGNLTINADGGTNTKINSVRIVPVSTPFLYWSATAQNLTVAQATPSSFTMQLRTSNLGTATASLSAVYGVGGSGWLTFNASQSTTTPTVNFTCQPGTLPVGKYTATVTAAATGYTGASFVVTMNIVASRPYVKASSPADGALNVSVSIANVAANSLYIPEVPGFKSAVNNATLSASTVKLLKISNGIETQLSGNAQGTVGGDAITFTPAFALEANTTYRFVITDGVKTQSGAAFLPYQATFKTGSVTTNGGQLTGVSFRPIPQTQTDGEQYTTLAIGPDRKLYGLMLTGVIKRFPINADGSLGTPQEIRTLVNTYGARSAVGLTFDPAATATNPVVWVSHCSAGLTNAPLFDGNISRLSGANLETAQLVITRLPRSKGDHLVNSMAFGTDGALYISQGSNSSMGAYDPTWQREESLLSGTILRLDRSKLTGLTLPLNVETTANLSYINSASSTSMRFPDGKYNPYASTSPLKIYASGVRNAYDLLWHSNGQLYVPTNGSASGGNSPASVVGTRRPNGSPYTGQAIPPTTAVQVQNDWLYRVNPAKPVGYYGHPNPLRGEYVPNRGYRDNSLYPTTIAADLNYRNAAYNFGLNKSPNGVIEYKNAVAFGGVLKGRILVCRFSGAGDIMVLEPGSMTKVTTTADDYIYDIVKAWTGQGTPGIPGLSGFANPLDIVEDTQTGNLYVSEHAWDENDTRPPRITLLKVSAVVGQGIATVSPAKIVENDVVGGTAGKYRTITLANTGSGNLKVTSIAVTGLDPSQFLMVGAPAASATSPYTLLPNSAVSFSVAFNPTTAGVKTAKVQISSENNTVREVVLSGLGTKGLGGTNEPSLQQVLDVHGVSVNAGDNDKTTSIINSLTPKATLLGGELHIQQFVRSNDGPVTVEVLGVFGPQSTGGTVTGFGWYPSGSTTTKNALFTVPNAGYQTVNVPVTGSRSFDPGSAVFGFYSQWPFFNNRVVYQEDRLNTFTGNIPHHLRVYPLKTATGTTVPDAYVLAHEEDVAGFDYQDIVMIIRNVKPAPATTVMIDFKPSTSATQTGYTPDVGLGYDATRGFGWIDPVTKAPKLNQTYARERAGTDELRVRTFNAMRPTSGGTASYANWEYKVNNGFYKVTVQVGDPGFYDSFHYINAEGVSVISNFIPTATTKYRVATKTVEVKDGKLTIDANGTPANNNTKIGYILITPATSLAGRLAADENPETEAMGLDVVAYPNPTDGHVTLAFTGQGAEEKVAVSVISPIGVVCRQENHTLPAENGSLALDMADLKAGTYLIKVQSGERVKLLRVVKR
jgi:phage baseplate assembly protein gpV